MDSFLSDVMRTIFDTMKNNFFVLVAGVIVLLGISGQGIISFAEPDPITNILAVDESKYPTNHVRNYFFGCTKYVPTFHCDPISNEFESSTVVAKYTKVLSVSREPAFTDGVLGKAVILKANTLEFITVNNSDVFQAPTFSVFIKVKVGNSENIPGSLISYTNGEHNTGWKVDLNPTEDPNKINLKFIVFNTEGTAIQTDDTAIDATRFENILGTFDGTSVKIFLNGVLSSKVSFEGTYSPKLDSTFPLKFGGASYCSCDTVTASIDEIHFYNYSISDEFVNDILSENSSQSKPVGLWKFDGDLKDKSGFGNDAFYNTLISSMGFSPDGRLFYTEKNSGNIRILESDGNLLSKPFASLSDVYVDWEEGLLGLTLDSDFENNHYVYTYYNYKDKSSDQIFARVVRFTDSDNIGKDTKTVFDKIPASKGFHTGGAIANNKSDDKLYIFVGDATLKEKAQDTSVLYGKILRINKDGTIPKDNPIPDSPIYTYGHRNAFGIAFDDYGNGILAESGPETFDEINLIQKGGNYGWPTLQQPNIAPESFTNNSSIKPLRSYFQPPSPTQTIYYENQNYPELKDSFLFGTVRGTLFSFKIDPEKRSLQQETRIDLGFYPYKPVIGLASSPTGVLYFGAYEIYKLDDIDFTNKNILMYPIEINSTNILVSKINFFQNDNRLVFDLQDEPEPSHLSIKIPKSMIKNLEDINVSSETSLANDGKTLIRLPHKVQSTTNNDFSIITLEIPEDYSKDDNLQFSLQPSELSVTKTIPEFGLAQIILLLSICILFIFSKNISSFRV